MHSAEERMASSPTNLSHGSRSAAAPSLTEVSHRLGSVAAFSPTKVNHWSGTVAASSPTGKPESRRSLSLVASSHRGERNLAVEYHRIYMVCFRHPELSLMMGRT